MTESVKRPASLELDPVLHQQVRLAIASILAGRGETTFNEMRDALDTSDGNLATHLRGLEEAGYLSIDKKFAGRRPHSTYALSGKGRAAFKRYLAHLEKVLKEAKR